MKLLLDGKIALVTGAGSAVGKRTAMGLAQLGADVVLVADDRDRGAVLKQEVQRESGSSKVQLLVADLSSQREVHRLAHEFHERNDRLHLLVHTASEVFAERELTEDGVERTFAVNYLSPFLLTSLLIEPLSAGAPSRVLSVASRVHRTGTLDFDDLQGEHDYSPAKAYAQSKLATILFTYELAGRLDGSGITVNCVEPCWAEPDLTPEATGFPRALSLVRRVLRRSAKRRARSLLHVATAPELETISAECFSKSGNEKRTSADSYDPGLAAQLWEASESLVRVPVG